MIGDQLRRTRVLLGWSQRELGRRSGVPQSRISSIERTRSSDIRWAVIDRLFRALGLRYWLGVELPLIDVRQRDLVHARCSAHVSRRLVSAGWLTRTEVEVGGDRSRGWIDVLAFNPTSSALLVIEIKTELRDLGAIERTMNWYERESWAAARRIGWRPTHVGCALLVLQSAANDSVIASGRDAFRLAFPRRVADLRAIITPKAEPVSGRFLAMIDPRSRRANWIRPTRTDGRRSVAPYADYIDAVRRIEAG